MALDQALLPLAVSAAIRRTGVGVEKRPPGPFAVIDLRDFSDWKRWLRGALVCGSLSFAVLQFAPGLEPLPGGAPDRLTDDQRAEFNALGLAPLSAAARGPVRSAPTPAVEVLAAPPTPRIVETTVRLGKGEAVGQALVRAGLSGREAGAIAAFIRPGEVRPGAEIRARLGPLPERGGARPFDRVLIHASLGLRLSAGKRGGELVLSRIPVAVDGTPLRIQQTVGGNLEQSLLVAGIPPGIAREFVREISQRTSVARLSPDDRFDLIMEQRVAATGERETGRLLYAGILRKGAPPLSIMRWNGPAPVTVSDYPAALGRPLDGRVTSGFGPRRHPILGFRRFHRGVDIRAAFGTPVRAVADGRITLAGWNGGYGKQVRIQHAGGLASSYAHMSSISARSGAVVRRGEVIGRVGWTGLTTGPHLHYELYRNGRAVDPSSVASAPAMRAVPVQPTDFERALRGLLSVPVARAGPDRLGLPTLAGPVTASR